jgi:hypothetical protein
MHGQGRRVEQGVVDAAIPGEQRRERLHGAADGAFAPAHDPAQVRNAGVEESPRLRLADPGLRRQQGVEQVVAVQRGLHQQQRRVAVTQDVRELGPARKGADGHQHSARHADRKGRDDPLGAVAHEERDPRPLADPGGQQRARQPAGLGLELAVARVPPVEDHGGALRVTPDDVAQEVPEGEAGVAGVHGRAQGEGSTISAWPWAITRSSWFFIVTRTVATGWPDGSP